MHEQDTPPPEAPSPGLRASRAAPPRPARRAGLDWSGPARPLEVVLLHLFARQLRRSGALRHDAWRTGRRVPPSSATRAPPRRTDDRMPGLRLGAALPRRAHARLHGRVAGVPEALRTGLEPLVGPPRRPAADAPRRRRLRRAAPRGAPDPLGAVGGRAPDGPLPDPRARRPRRAAPARRARSAPAGAGEARP